MEVCDQSDVRKSQRINHQAHKTWIFGCTKSTSHSEEIGYVGEEGLVDPQTRSQVMGSCCSTKGRPDRQRKVADSQGSLHMLSQPCKVDKVDGAPAMANEEDNSKEPGLQGCTRTSSVKDKIRHFNNRILNHHGQSPRLHKQASFSLDDSDSDAMTGSVDRDNKCNGRANRPASGPAINKVLLASSEHAGGGGGPDQQHQHWPTPQKKLAGSSMMVCSQCHTDINVKQQDPNITIASTPAHAQNGPETNTTSLTSCAKHGKVFNALENEQVANDPLGDPDHHPSDDVQNMDTPVEGSSDSKPQGEAGLSLFTRRTGQQLSTLMDSTSPVDNSDTQQPCSEAQQNICTSQTVEKFSPKKVTATENCSRLPTQSKKTLSLGSSRDFVGRGKSSTGRPVLKKRHSEPSSAGSSRGGHGSLEGREKCGRLRRKTCVVHLDGCRFTIGKLSEIYQLTIYLNGKVAINLAEI